MSCAGCGALRPVWSHPGTAQEPRRRPTEGPGEVQDSPTRPREPSRGAQTRLGAISKRFHSDLGAPRTSKNLKKCCTVSEIRGFRDFAREPSTEAQKHPKGAPRGAQMSPRRAPGDPRSGPRAPKTAPRAARSAPIGAQDHPGPPQERTQGAPSRPDASREPFGRSFWPHLGAPGASFSSLLRSFSGFARDPLDKRSHSSNKPVVTGLQCDALANLLVDR